MITIIVATNREGSRSAIIAEAYREILEGIGEEARVLNLGDFSPAMIEAVLYRQDADQAGFEMLQDIVDTTDKFVFVIPEYNGSFPGVLKVFIDCCRYPDSFVNKKAAIVGLSSGTQGSALAMGHFSDILGYLGVHTLGLRPRFIRVHGAIKDGKLVDEEYLSFLQQQAEQLQAF